MKLTSPAFGNGERIPSRYTCDGENVSPVLEVSDVPKGALSLALVMDDPDIPEEVKRSLALEVFVHWVVFNIPPDTAVIGQVPPGAQGANSSGGGGYTGPCPPDQEHRYLFKLYALDTLLDLPPGSAKQDVEEAMEGHALATAELLGRYERV